MNFLCLNDGYETVVDGMEWDACMALEEYELFCAWARFELTLTLTLRDVTPITVTASDMITGLAVIARIHLIWSGLSMVDLAWSIEACMHAFSE